MLIDAALRFPTVIFTIGLGIILVYWLFVLLGALDIDLFGDADVAGAGKGIGDALAGGAKAGGEAIGDAIGGGHDVGDVGGGHDVGGHADGGGDHDIGDTHSGGIWSGLGLSKVPITISVSVIFFVCWLMSLLAMYYLPDAVGAPAWLAPVTLLATLVIGLPLAGLLVRPLAPVFEVKEGRSNKDCIGQVCEITTGNVTDKFGQATVEDGGTVLVIHVVCDRSDVLARGHKALIIDFDTERQAFVVEPVTDMLPASNSGESA